MGVHWIFVGDFGSLRYLKIGSHESGSRFVAARCQGDGTSANSIEYFLAFLAFGESLSYFERLHTLVPAAGALAASSHPARG
jgi:hypothetical protein